MPQIGVAIAGVIGAFQATAVGTFLTTTFTGRLLASVALSALQVALAPKPKAPGITTEFTANGGTNPCGFILGKYATAGDAVCPPMTHGVAGKTPNAYLTYVVALGDIAGQTLERVMIDGAYVDLGTTPHADYGLPVTGRFAGYAWVKYYDGSQTVADPMLLSKYAAYPERPWLSDMIGTGIPYAICTFRFNRKLFQALPSVLFQCGGIKVYDPRKDTTVGGSGAHRWGTASTYELSRNNAVLAYVPLSGPGVVSLVGPWRIIEDDRQAAVITAASPAFSPAISISAPSAASSWGTAFAAACWSSTLAAAVIASRALRQTSSSVKRCGARVSLKKRIAAWVQPSHRGCCCRATQSASGTAPAPKQNRWRSGVSPCTAALPMPSRTRTRRWWTCSKKAGSRSPKGGATQNGRAARPPSQFSTLLFPRSRNECARRQVQM